MPTAERVIVADGAGVVRALNQAELRDFPGPPSCSAPRTRTWRPEPPDRAVRVSSALACTGTFAHLTGEAPISRARAGS
ncbi:hypothetical protein [Amycolatopsis sp. cmx-8-4]|uniref:hypothetical protein n=1 Tax=Amycolatopsis sp. cmx-8-4 TaxID=2790947 RepID=UPI00397A2DF1